MPGELNEESIISFDDIFYTTFVVNEESRGKRPGVLSTIEGPFMEIDAKNRNDRTYPFSLIKNKIVEDKYTIEMLNNKILLGEPRHPKDRFEIWMTDASHNITDLWISEDKKFLMGKADILDTPYGRVIQTLVDYGSKIGVSARASGALKKSPKGFIADEATYKFRTFDFVTNPGFMSSRVEEISESVEEHDYQQSIYTGIKKLIEERETDASTLKAVKSILEATDFDKDKELFNLLEARLTEGSDATVMGDSVELRAANMEINSLEQRVNDMYEEIGSLQQGNKQLEKENIAYRSVLVSKSSSIKSLEEDISVKESSLISLQESVVSLSDDLVRAKRGLVVKNSKIKELTESLNESYSAIKDYHSQSKEYTTKIDDLSQALVESQKEAFKAPEKPEEVLVESVQEKVVNDVQSKSLFRKPMITKLNEEVVLTQTDKKLVGLLEKTKGA